MDSEKKQSKQNQRNMEAGRGRGSKEEERRKKGGRNIKQILYCPVKMQLNF
jgi:hypothetical protein